MQRKITALSECYASALRQHLKQGAKAGLPTARRLGRQAVSLGLETLDVARMHEAALAALGASARRDGVMKRAEFFFIEAVLPIERTHRAALTANARLEEMNQALNRRKADLAASNHSLKQSVIRRKNVEKALTKSEDHSKKRLAESRLLQKKLRSLTHELLTLQEAKRKKISRELHDEIAQTLLGINVRLVILKKEAALKSHSFTKDMASTQQLTDKVEKSIKRFARRIGKT